MDKKQTKPRLYFIDFARSIAIIMMLEGHFTGAALANQYRDGSNWIFSFWHNLHGLTSPLFFTTSGLIFAYLLTGTSSDIAYLQNDRVRKGFKRVVELLFWGYIIQLSVFTLGKDLYYGSEWHLDWFYAFHVLQSIGVGIFLLLVLFGLKKLI
jgi:surface polysaccharide O-acyltransferase-like enzyme